jgi:hypothetical protein
MNRFTELFILIIYLAIIFTLVRPNSQGPSLIKAFGSAFSGIIGAATGGGSFNQKLS